MSDDRVIADCVFNKRAAALSESSIGMMVAKAQKLRAEGRQIIDLSAGVPDFDTPDEIKQAAVSALAAGYTKYTPVPGIASLREAIVGKLKRENRLEYVPDGIIVSNGVKQALANVCMAFLEPGDEVIIISPFWVAYPGLVRFAGAKPVIIQTYIEDGFRLDLDAFAAAITDATKLVIINSPSNPSGVVYTREELQGVIALCRKNPYTWIVSDEIYDSILFEGEHVSPASLPDGFERTITLNGLSKSFAMTGWRIGYAAVPLNVAAVLSNMQGILTSGANSFVQHAAAFALNEMTDVCSLQCASYLQRRDIMMNLLHDIPNVNVYTPAGTFYVFPDISAYFGRTYNGHTIRNADDLATYLLYEASVAIVSGTGFGNNNCIRITFAASMNDIRKGIEQISGALQRLSLEMRDL